MKQLLLYLLLLFPLIGNGMEDNDILFMEPEDADSVYIPFNHTKTRLNIINKANEIAYLHNNPSQYPKHRQKTISSTSRHKPSILPLGQTHFLPTINCGIGYKALEYVLLSEEHASFLNLTNDEGREHKKYEYTNDSNYLNLLTMLTQVAAKKMVLLQKEYTTACLSIMRCKQTKSIHDPIQLKDKLTYDSLLKKRRTIITNEETHCNYKPLEPTAKAALLDLLNLCNHFLNNCTKKSISPKDHEEIVNQIEEGINKFNKETNEHTGSRRKNTTHEFHRDLHAKCINTIKAKQQAFCNKVESFFPKNEQAENQTTIEIKNSAEMLQINKENEHHYQEILFILTDLLPVLDARIYDLITVPAQPTEHSVDSIGEESHSRINPKGTYGPLTPDQDDMTQHANPTEPLTIQIIDEASNRTGGKTNPLTSPRKKSSTLKPDASKSFVEKNKIILTSAGVFMLFSVLLARLAHNNKVITLHPFLINPVTN